MDPQQHPYPNVLRAHIMRVIDAIVDGDQVTDKDYVDALFALVSGALVYQGVWDASTNTPTLADGTGTTGYFYAVTVGGTQDLGSGNITFTAGDRVIHNGTIWQKWDTNDVITSVFSRVGDIISQNGDYTASQLTNVPAGTIAAVTVQAAIDELDAEKVTAAEALLAAWANIDTKSFENLLIDGNFEASTVSPYWTSFGPTARTIEGTIVKIGTQAVKLSVPAPIPTAAYINQDVVDFTRYQGRKVTFNVWVRCPAGNAFDSVIEIDDGVGVTTSSVVPKDDTYHLMSITHTMDAAATRMRGILYLRKTTSVSTTDVAYFDGCMFVEGDSGPAYGDCSPLYQDISGIFRGAIILAGVVPVDADIATWNTRDRGIGTAFAINRIFFIYKDIGGIRYEELSTDGIVSIDDGDSPYSFGPHTWTTLLCNATGGAIAVNLPQAVKYEGMVYRIKKTDGSANAITITPNGIETIDGAASKVLSTQNECIELLCDGTGWIVLYPTTTLPDDIENGGSKEMNVGGLSGELADDQPPKSHGISDNTKHSGALVNDNITLGDANGLVKDSGVAISSIVGGLNYQGIWDASTNTPALADGTGTKGHYYRVSVAGSQDLGSGSITFAVEDYVAHNGSIWQKIDHTDQVTSVFTRQGAVVALASDYDASQIDNDSGVAGAFVDDALDQLDSDIPIQATEAVAGIGEIATQPETNTGTDDDRIVTPLKLTNFVRTRRYLVSTRVRVGVGGGAAIDGQIQDVPVILFNATQIQEADMANHIHPGIDLSAVNPFLEFHFLASVTAAGVGTETVRMQLEIRYRADGEGFDGAYDETLIADIDIATGVAYVHFHNDFTLDRTKMAAGDGFSVKITRIGNHGNDDYPDDIGLENIWLVYEGKGGE